MYLRKSAFALMASAVMFAPSTANAFDWSKLWWPSKPLSPLERAYPQNNTQAQPASGKPASAATAAKVIKVADTPLKRANPYDYLMIQSKNPEKTNITVSQVNDTAVKIMTSVDGKIKETARATSDAVAKVSQQNKQSEERVTKIIKGVDEKVKTVDEKVKGVEAKVNKVAASVQAAARFSNKPEIQPKQPTQPANQIHLSEKQLTLGQDFAEKTAAVSVAVSGLRFDNTPGRISVSIGSGSFNRKTALAFGIGYTTDDAVLRMNASFATNGSQHAIGMGLTYSFNVPNWRK